MWLVLNLNFCHLLCVKKGNKHCLVYRLQILSDGLKWGMNELSIKICGSDGRPLTQTQACVLINLTHWLSIEQLDLCGML